MPISNSIVFTTSCLPKVYLRSLKTGAKMKEKDREIIISGYGPDETKETSIGLFELTDTLKVAQELWSDRVKAPSFLCTYHEICFGIKEESKDASILCYERTDMGYILRDELRLNGGGLCHISYQPKSQVLYCSFYETGHIAAVKVKDYHFTGIISFIKMKPEEETGLTRAHCSALEPAGTGVLVSNIALDRIYIFESLDGALVPNPYCEFVQLPKGIGPRHLKFHPLLNFLYLITEYSNEIYVFLYEKSESCPKLTILQTISTLKEDFIEESFGSSLDISKDGRFLYAANRGANSITVYDIGTDGLLTRIQEVSCGGDWPRHIALTKDDYGLMVCNQYSNEVVIFSLDENKGILMDITDRKYFYKPAYAEEIIG